MLVGCRHAPSGKQIFIDAKGSWLKFVQDFPMSAAEMLKAIEEAGNYNVYGVFNVGSGCATSLIRILNPAELVRQKQLKYWLQL